MSHFSKTIAQSADNCEKAVDGRFPRLTGNTSFVPKTKVSDEFRGLKRLFSIQALMLQLPNAWFSFAFEMIQQINCNNKQAERRSTCPTIGKGWRFNHFDRPGKVS
jgi:hypothetical protein